MGKFRLFMFGRDIMNGDRRFMSERVMVIGDTVFSQCFTCILVESKALPQGCVSGGLRRQ